MSSGKCVKLVVDFDDETILYMAKAASLLYLKHSCSRSFVDETLSKIELSNNGNDDVISQSDLNKIQKAFGEAIINDFITDALLKAVHQDED